MRISHKLLPSILAFCIIGLSLWVYPILAQGSPREVDVISAVQQGLVDLNVEATGDSYYGPGTLTLEATNLTGQPLTIVIPQGLRFEGVDTTYQDEIVALPERIDLQPGETKTTELTSFCGNAHRAAPAAGAEYTPGEMEGRQMQQLLSEIEQEGLYDDMEGQWAVWNLTDDMPAMPDFGEILNDLDALGSTGIVRDVAESAPSIAGPVVRDILRAAWLKAFWWLFPLAIAILLLLLLLWWLLTRNRPTASVYAPERRKSEATRKPKKKRKPQPPGANITHGRPKPKKPKKHS